MSFVDTPQENISTIVTSKPKTPDVTITNPLDKTGVFVNLIEIIPDAEFAKRGKLVIEINGVPIFDNTDKSDSFKGVARKQIPLDDQELRRGSMGKIKFFAWNGDNSNIITATVAVKISESSQADASSIIPLSQLESNQIISEGETLFADQARPIATYTQLVDMKGFKKLIVILNSPTPDLSGLSTSWTGAWGTTPPTNAGRTIDGKLTAKTGDKIPQNTDSFLTVDFGSIANRALKIKHDIQRTSGVLDFVIETSDDNSNWTTKLSKQYTASIVITEDGTEHSFRFARFTYTEVTTSVYLIAWHEVWDNLILGGQGDLSFEVLEDVANTWNEFIASTEFGTITDETATIVQQVGDVITVSVSGKTYGLPSTQTNFRAKYVISVGALKNSVSIQRVA